MKPKVSTTTLLWALLMMMLLPQTLLAQKTTPTLEITDVSNNTVLVDGGTLSTTYHPNWVGFEKPTVALFTETGGVRTSQADKYQITYYINGHESDTSFCSNANGQYTTDDGVSGTGTIISRFFGDVTIGSSAGTVTIKVIAKVKEAFASLYTETISQTYQISIVKVTPTVSASPSPINIKVRQAALTQNEHDSKWSYRNSAQKVALPTPTVSITLNGVTQDLSEYYDIAFAPKSGSEDKLYIVNNGDINNDGYTTYLSAKLTGTDSIGSELSEAEDAVKPYSGGSAATLTATFTPKEGFSSSYNTTTLDIPVNIQFTETKQSATISMMHPLTGAVMAAGDTLHYVKYGRERGNSHDLHPFPVPVVTGTDGIDLSTHKNLAVYYYVVKDSTYFDYCERPETNPSGPVTEAGQSTEAYICDRPYSHNLSGNPGLFQNNKPGLLKLGMVIVADNYANDGGIENWYDFTTKRPFEHTKTGYEQHDTEYKCLGDTTYFYIDVMKRSPRLVFDPDPSTVTISCSDTISFNNRFNLMGVIGDENDGIAGTLTYGAQWGDGDDTFWYSFEFPADAGISIIDWPHYDRMVALDEDGEIVTATGGWDWSNGGKPIYTHEDSTKIKSWKYWSVKGWGTDKLWKIAFTKITEPYFGKIPMKYTIWPWNHVRWDIGEEQVIYYQVTEGRTPTLNIDPAELVATINQPGFAEPDVWVTDNLGHEVSDDFTFTFTIGSDPNSTGTTVANSTDNTFRHEVTIGGSAGDVTVHVVATAKSTELGYTTTVLTGDYLIHILDGSPLYEIISSKDDGAVRNSGNTGTTDYDYAIDKVMGKMHFIGTGTIYAGYTISGVPGLNIRFGKYDGSTWQVKEDTSGEIGSHDNNNDIVEGHTAGQYNKYITDDTPVSLDEDGIATGGSFYEFYALTNGFLTVDARWEAGQTYVLIDYDYPSIKQEFTPGSLVKGDHTFTMPLEEDHSYHLYCKSGGKINMHGLSFEPAFINSNSDTAPVTTGSAFLNGLPTVPTLAEVALPMVTYSSGNNSKATVNSSTGEVTPLALTFADDPNYVKITGKVASQVTTLASKVFKMPYYDLVIADIPTYRLGDGLDESGAELDQNTFGGAAGQKVTTYNFPTPIRMTYGGWQNTYIQRPPVGEAKEINGDAWENKGEYGVGGFTSEDHQFNKFIDGFSWSNVCKQNPSDEEGYTDYKNYLTGADNMSKGRDGYYMNTFTLPAHGSYWRFEPQTSGYLFVYLVQNGVCSYTGDPHSLLNTSKNYERLDWKPLYIVDETGTPVATDISFDNTMNAGVKSFLGDHATYTEGLIRCGKDDENVKANTGLTSQSNDGTVFQWKKTTITDGVEVESGFDADYKGSNANKTALHTTITSAWTGAGNNQTIFKDNESNGYALISKAYVRYAIHVKAGKSYWVFQNNSKPQFCGFGFVPDGFNGTPASFKGPEVTDTYTISDNADNDDFAKNLVTQNKVCNVRYTDRTFKNKQWMSLCLPFAVSEYNFKKVFGENANIVTFNNLNDSKTNIHFVQHNYRMMEAGRPYFVYPNWGDEITQKTELQFDSITFEGKLPADDITDNDKKIRIIEDKGLQFVGNYTATTMPKWSYCLSANDGSLKRTTKEAGTALKPYRAYLKNPESDATLANIGITDYEQPYEDVPADEQPETTRIIGISDANAYDLVDGSLLKRGVYTIDGQLISTNSKKVGKLASGVYIINGKKKIVK